MDNFNIHKYLKKEYLSESVDDESAEYYFDYLNKLRDSGKTNMFGAAPYLQAVFGLDKRTAREILSKWMKSMNEDRKAKEYIKSIEDEDEREEERKRMFDNPEDLDESLNENFEMGDRVKLTPDYEETPGEVFTITQISGNRYFIADKDGRGWYTYGQDLVMADDELDEVELTQDFGELDEDHTKRENNQLKKISKQLKKSVKSQSKQSKIIDKIVKEVLSEATFEDEIARLEDTMYTEKRDTRIFIHPLDKPDAFRPSGNYVVVDGNNVTSVQGYNTGPISDLADKYGLNDEDSMTMGKTNARGKVSLLSSNILRDAIKAIEDSRDLEAKSQSDYYSSKPDTGRIGYGLSRQPRMNEIDMNDPVLMRMRASKPEPSRGGLDFEDVMYLRDEQKDLEDRIAQLYRDMEQEAEPEGGDVADRYGSMLNKLEDKLYRVKKQINQYDMNESTLNERVIYDNERQRLEARIAADDFMRIYRAEFRRMFTNFGKEAEAEFKKIVKDKFSRLQEGSCGYTPDGKSRNKPASSDLIKLKEKLEQVNEKLCKKGEAYRKRRMAAGEKSSAYLSGRAVKVCKGQMGGNKKKK